MPPITTITAPTTLPALTRRARSSQPFPSRRTELEPVGSPPPLEMAELIQRRIVARIDAPARDQETVSLRSEGPGSPPDQAKPSKELREAVGSVVGTVFYGTLLKAMRNSVLKGEFGHGGRGEEVFQAQLDQMLVERVGQASGFSLHEALYKRLAPAAEAKERSGEVRDLRLGLVEGVGV